MAAGVSAAVIQVDPKRDEAGLVAVPYLSFQA